MPTTLPPSSTGRRRTCRAAMSRVASRASSSGETTAQLRVMMSFTWVWAGSSSAAMQRRTMSRSVTMPRRPPSFPHTGRAPRLCRDSSRAAREADSWGVMVTTLGFMRSRTCITKPPFLQTFC